MIIRLTINLTPEEELALMRVAVRELRALDDVARRFIRKGLIELGELKDDEDKEARLDQEE